MWNDKVRTGIVIDLSPNAEYKKYIIELPSGSVQFFGKYDDELLFPSKEELLASL